jgi:glutamyl-tRNA synthetase
MTAVRTRFAPSPTGYLHIGSARTALYCWLYAKKMKGTFILRIEDTDAERSTTESVQAILDAMQWMNMDYDEGPFYQTQRFDRYKAVTEQLLAEGKAYKCYCSKERLEILRAEQMENKQKPRYDGLCRNLSEPQAGSFVVRFRNPETGSVQFDDMVRGSLSFENTELDDLIIARSDGWPTYNFTVVVDDLDMQITHVIRGDDHINNTPRQINIFHALNAQPPVYAHLSTILGSDGKRLSKRHGAVSVMQYKDEGYLPESLMNYLARLGWSHGDQEIFSKDELIEFFDFDHISKSSAAFNPEKLLWLNQHYLKTNDVTTVAAELLPFMTALGLDVSQGPDVIDVVKALNERSKTLVEMAEKSACFYKPIEYNPVAVKQHLTIDAVVVLAQLQIELQAVTDWQVSHLHDVIVAVADKLSLKMGKIAQPLRVALTGDVISPSIDVTLFLMGKERTLERLTHAIKRCSE